MDGMPVIQSLVDDAREQQAAVVESGAKQCKLLVTEAFLLLSYSKVKNASNQQEVDSSKAELRKLCVQEQLFMASNPLNVRDQDFHKAFRDLIRDETMAS